MGLYNDDQTALWHREGRWLPAMGHFHLAWTDEPFVAEGKHIGVDIEAVLAGRYTIDRGVAPVFDRYPRNENGMASVAPTDDKTKKGYALACTVLDDEAVGDEPFVVAANNVSWTRFVEELFQRCKKEFGKGSIPVLFMLSPQHWEGKKGSTSWLRYRIAGWIARPADMINIGQSWGTIDTAEPPVLTSAEPAPALAFAGIQKPLTIADMTQVGEINGEPMMARKEPPVAAKVRMEDILDDSLEGLFGLPPTDESTPPAAT